MRPPEIRAFEILLSSLCVHYKSTDTCPCMHSYILWTLWTDLQRPWHAQARQDHPRAIHHSDPTRLSIDPQRTVRHEVRLPVLGVSRRGADREVLAPQPRVEQRRLAHARVTHHAHAHAARPCCQRSQQSTRKPLDQRGGAEDTRVLLPNRLLHMPSGPCSSILSPAASSPPSSASSSCAHACVGSVWRRVWMAARRASTCACPSSMTAHRDTPDTKGTTTTSE